MTGRDCLYHYNRVKSSVLCAVLAVWTAGLLTGCGAPLIAATMRGDAAAVRQVVNRDHPTQAELDDALHTAAAQQKPEVVKTLLSLGANVNAADPRFGYTPLMEAAALGDVSPAGCLEIAKILIVAGADPTAKNANGQTATDQARRNGASSMASYLESLAKTAVASTFALSVPAAVPPLTSVVVPALNPDYSSTSATDDYAVVVGIESYPDLPAAAYAERDAASAKSFIRALGVPERNIVLLTGNRATKTGMEKTLEAWLPNNVSEKSRVYVYYSGHGAPDTKTGDAYLVPSDGDPQYLAQTGYPLKRLYAKLGELKAKSVLVALDSCFSGAGGRSVLAKGTRPLVGKVDTAVPARGKVSVISASAGDQISGANEEAGYGLFTYNFLQGLNGAAKDAQGRVTLQSLYAYLKPRVQDDARRGNREQTPQLQGGGEDLILRAN